MTLYLNKYCLHSIISSLKSQRLKEKHDGLLLNITTKDLGNYKNISSIPNIRKSFYNIHIGLDVNGFCLSTI